MPPLALAGIVFVAALLSCGPADAVRRIDKQAIVTQGNRCDGAYVEVKGDIPGWGEMVRKERVWKTNWKGIRQNGTVEVDKMRGGGRIASQHECVTFCETITGCWSYEWSPTTRQCNLNTKREPTTQTSWKDFYFCQKAVEGQDKHQSCSPGWTQVEGDIAGWGVVGFWDESRFYGQGGGQHTSQKRCSELCDHSCWSYEWSPSTNQCNLNEKRVPDTHHSYKDFLFCQKQFSCHAGFTHVPGDIPGKGWKGYSTSANHKECGGDCYRDPLCLSYEWDQHRYKCHFNKEREPTRPDYKTWAFCRRDTPGNNDIDGCTDTSKCRRRRRRRRFVYTLD